MSDNALPEDVPPDVEKDQEELDRIARESSKREKEFQRRRAPPETMPRPGDTSKVGHVPGLG